MKVSALVVVYNERIIDIACLDRLLAAGVVDQIVICDNSTNKNDNEQIAAERNLTYLSMHGNKGLSAAYNVGISHCTGEVICVFDDDTMIVDGYFEELERVWHADPNWDIALPLVLSNGEMLSPVLFDGFRAVPLSSEKKLIGRAQISGINSGMAVKAHVFNLVKYDENLFLDLIDHRFCSDALKANLSIAFYPDMLLSQTYSLSTDSADQAAKRYSLFKQDVKTFYSDDFIHAIYGEAMIAYRKARLAMKYGWRFFTAK